jgi:hypothetical protein
MIILEDIVNQENLLSNEGRFKYIIFDENLSQAKADELTTKYFNDIKTQRIADPFGWIVPVESYATQQ